MHILSEAINTSGVFEAELNSLFPQKPFDTENILTYVSACDTVVLREARKAYHTHGLQFINPVFAIDEKIYPPAQLPGNPDVVRLAKANIQLIEKKSVLPLSKLITSNKLQGICLCDGMQVFYQGFLSFDLSGLRTNYSLLKKGATEEEIVDIISSIDLDTDNMPADFNSFCEALGLIFSEDRKRIARTLLLYKSFFEVVYEQPIYISFINSSSEERSFFDLLFTVVSLKPFSEEELRDFAGTVQQMAAPLDSYYKKTGVTRQNNDKKAAQIQRELLNSLRGTAEKVVSHKL